MSMSHPVDSTYFPCCNAIGRHADGCTAADTPLGRHLRFIEDALMGLSRDLLREAANAPTADEERHTGLHDAASRLRHAADDVRFVRQDVAGLALASLSTAEIIGELHRRGVTDDDIAAAVGATAEQLAALVARG